MGLGWKSPSRYELFQSTIMTTVSLDLQKVKDKQSVFGIVLQNTFTTVCTASYWQDTICLPLHTG